MKNPTESLPQARWQEVVLIGPGLSAIRTGVGNRRGSYESRVIQDFSFDRVSLTELPSASIYEVRIPRLLGGLV
jgi:hypothetical protein